MAEVAIYAAELTEDRVRAHAVSGGLVVPATARADAASPKPLELLTLERSGGLRWDLWRGERGWTLGQMWLDGKPLEAPATAGVLDLHDVKTGERRWLPADRVERLGPAAAKLHGQGKIHDASIRFSVDISLREDLPAATWTVEWSLDRDVDGWEVCLTPWEQLSGRWRCWLYPFAGNSLAVDVKPLRYCGVRAAVIYRPDLSAVALFGIDPTFDYLNPATWTGQTSFHFRSQRTPPQYAASGARRPAAPGWARSTSG